MIGERLKGIRWRKFFPHPSVWEWQEKAIQMILNVISSRRGVVLELPPGSGKTALAVWFLNICKAIGLSGARVIVTPTKGLVGQIVRLYPGTRAMYGRSEYKCLYAHSRGKPAQADEVPCLMLVKRGLCPHYVPSLAQLPRDVDPCEYYLAKAQAEEGDNNVACTMAYFLLNRLFARRPRKIAGLAIDEVDKLGEMARMVFTYDITDWHLQRLQKLIARYDKIASKRLTEFLQQMISIAQKKPAQKPTLLSSYEIELLVKKLELIEFDCVRETIGTALEKGDIDFTEYQEELAAFEKIDYQLKRYLHSFEYAVKTETRNPLNYVFAYYKKDPPEDERVRYLLRVSAFYVAPLIRTCLEGVGRVFAYSGTVASRDTDQEDAFRFETGINFPIERLPSPYPVERMRLFMPSDTPNLAFKVRKPGDVDKAMKMGVEAIIALRQEDIRTLVVVESEEERQQFLVLGEKYGLQIVTYSKDRNPRKTLSAFQQGEGEVLLGVSAHYGRGIDLPDEVARVVIALRPAFKRPDDPEAQFEKERFPHKYRARWTLLAANAARQLIGRVVRNKDDFGLTIFISEHYQKFLPGALPYDRKPAWISGKTMDECVQEAIEFIKTYRQAP